MTQSSSLIFGTIINLISNSPKQIVSYGVPASGVLCFELLKQSRNPPSLSRPHLYLSRSETIQNLSLFVSFLDQVRRHAPNFDVCCRMKEIISRVLDQVLETTTTQSQQAWNVTSDCAGYSMEWFDFDAFANGEWDWFGAAGGEADWMKTPWVTAA